MSAVIGHRGASGLERENSWAAFEAAARLGVGWVETDARLISDGSVILFHDDRLLRLTGDPGRAFDLTATTAAARGLVCLKDLLPRAGALGLGINIELKVERGAGGAERLADAVAGIIEAYEGPRRLLVSSFCMQALACMKRRLSDLPLGLLYRRLPDDWRETAETLAARTIHLRWQELRRGDIERIVEGGYEAYAYTVNDPQTARSLMAEGVSGVFTDYPDRFGLNG